MKLFLASIQLKITANEAIEFKLNPSEKFICPIVPTTSTYHCHYSTVLTIDLSAYKTVFTGESFNEQMMPYQWEILKAKNTLAIRVIFREYNEINEVVAIVNSDDKTINVQLIPKSTSPIIIDPMHHPLGSLLMVYLVYDAGGFMIHASGVRDKVTGHIFTAISGTGKTTIANLWGQSGATIINDDRLWLQKINGKWTMFNTPMVWYNQKPKMSLVSNIFMLRQSLKNEIKTCNGAASSMKIMANCIQHFYAKDMTDAHLDRVLDFTSQVTVFDCGFKPDLEIVEMIRRIV